MRAAEKAPRLCSFTARELTIRIGIPSLQNSDGIVGHSYGALCSLEAAMLTTNIGKMILNEPPMYTTVEVTFPADAPAEILAYAGADEWEKALVLLYEAGGMSEAELHLLRSLPSWHARIQAAPTMLREILSVREYAFDPVRFKNLKTPVLLLVGGENLPRLHRSHGGAACVAAEQPPCCAAWAAARCRARRARALCAASPPLPAGKRSPELRPRGSRSWRLPRGLSDAVPCHSSAMTMISQPKYQV